MNIENGSMSLESLKIDFTGGASCRNAVIARPPTVWRICWMVSGFNRGLRA